MVLFYTMFLSGFDTLLFHQMIFINVRPSEVFYLEKQSHLIFTNVCHSLLSYLTLLGYFLWPAFKRTWITSASSGLL